MPRRANGFIYYGLGWWLGNQFAPPYLVYCHLQEKECARNPRFQQCVNDRTLCSMGFKEPRDVPASDMAYYEETYNRLRAKATPISDRAQRVRAWVEQSNRAHLASLTIEQAREALGVDACDPDHYYSLKWYEQLPPGINHQAACNVTQQSFTVQWWEAHVLRSWHYQPNTAPRKFRAVAKRI